MNKKFNPLDKRLYPRDIAAALRRNWDPQSIFPRFPAINLPPPSVLTTLLEVCYYASLQTEEGRPTTFRVGFLDKTTRIKINNLAPTTLYEFEDAQPFTESSIRRLAPAADHNRTIIAVKQSNVFTGGLAIIGVVDVGSSLWKMSRHEARHGHGLPQMLIAETLRPGGLVIYKGSEVVLRLRNGKPTMPCKNVLLNGPISECFRNANHWFMSSACSEVHRPLDKVADETFSGAYINFIEMMLLSITDLHHGGTILFVPDEWNCDDDRLLNRVDLKYAMPSDRPSESLTSRMVARLEYSAIYDQLFGDKANKKVSSSDLKEFENRMFIEKQCDDALRDAARFIAGLTAVDGAVVMTDRLRLLGFGAEVRIDVRRPDKIRSATRADGTKYKEEQVSSYGTRHRSTFRFCSSEEKAVGFVVSQDGGLKAVRQVGADLTMWPDFKIAYGAEVR